MFPPDSRILITGAGGVVGSEFVRSFMEDKVEVLGVVNKTNIIASKLLLCDFTRLNELESFERIISQSVGVKNISVIIHCAAIKSIAACDNNPHDAMMVNVMSTAMLAEIAARSGIPFVFMSSDAVFTTEDYQVHNLDFPTEDDTTNPSTYYGETKAFAEQVIIQIFKKYVNNNYLIIRTSSIMGFDQGNFAFDVLSKITSGGKYTAYSDAYVQPVYVKTVVDIVRRLLKENRYGIFHVASQQIISRARFVRNMHLINSGINLNSPNFMIEDISLSRAEEAVDHKLIGINAVLNTDKINQLSVSINTLDEVNKFVSDFNANK